MQIMASRFSSCNAGVLCIAEAAAWSWRTVETKAGLSEPDAGPFFKSVEFHVQGREQNRSV